MRERLHITIDPEVAHFLRILSAHTKTDVSRLLELGAKLLQYYIAGGSDDLLAIINAREPPLATKLTRLRSKALEPGSPVRTIVEPSFEVV